MNMCKGGDSTKEVSLNAVNYPFNPFFGGLQNSFSCGPCSCVSTYWPAEEAGYVQRGSGHQGGAGRWWQSESKHENSSQSSEKNVDFSVWRPSRMGGGKTEMASSWKCPGFLEGDARSELKGKRDFQGELWLTNPSLSQASIYHTHLQQNRFNLLLLLKPEFKTCT